MDQNLGTTGTGPSSHLANTGPSELIDGPCVSIFILS
ncbi:hypothetical protein JOD29_003339 [Lysinibacillus composti]|nr:hypothetical protein [Lysinibacillus composti]